jgi:hypothetical protein
MKTSNEAQKIGTRTARSGKVSYGDPVYLTDNTKTRVSFIPFFIPHSDYTELAAKIVIGRSNEWDDDQTKALHGLNQRLRSIKIMTYDHLLAQSEAMLQLVDSPSTAASVSFDHDFSQDFDDEIAF